MLVFKSHGGGAPTFWPVDAFLEANKAHWLVNEIRASTGSGCSSASTSPSRTLVTLVEPGSCFVGKLAELVFAADRSYMLIGLEAGRQSRARRPSNCPAMNFGPYPMSHGPDSAANRDFRPIHPILERAAEKKESARRSMPRQPSNSALVTFALDDHRLGRRKIRGVLRGGAPVFRPTASPAWKRTCASSDPRTMESKNFFPPDGVAETGSFSAPNAVGRTPARSSATALVRGRSSI